MQVDYRKLNKLLGNIDIYLLDQILKGTIPDKCRILDAGCGDGRNLIYFLRNHYEVYGIDQDEESIQMLRHIARSIDKFYSTDRFMTGNVEKLPFSHEQFDVVISNTVLHFAESEEHFISMFGEHTRVLKKGGIFFIRMATSIGIESDITPLGNGRYIIPDGSERYLLTRKSLQHVISHFGYEFVEPFKTVLVEDMRSMSAFVLRKI